MDAQELEIIKTAYTRSWNISAVRVQTVCLPWHCCRWVGGRDGNESASLYFFARKDGLTQLTISAMAENWRKVLSFSPNFDTELSLNSGM